MHILVTGANGFIGREMCRGLQAMGHDVRRVVRDTAGSADAFSMSSTDKISEAVRGIECVIHLAQQASVPPGLNRGEVAVSREENVQLTRRLALMAHQAGVRRFVFVSSIKACSAASFGGLHAGRAPSLSTDLYATLKKESEQALREVGKGSGLEVVIVRPPLVYGEGVKGNFLRLLIAVEQGLPLPFAGLTNKRSILYLPNLVSALAACALSPEACGETFDVSDDQSVTLPQLVGELAMAMGRPAKLIYCPECVLRLAGKVLGRQSQVNGMLENVEIDSSKIRGLLTWRPSFTVRQGIQETVRWYLDAGKLCGDSSVNEEVRPSCGDGL